MTIRKWAALAAVTLSVMPFLAKANIPAGKCWLVAVGVDDYILPSVPDLQFANGDAKLLTQAFVDVAKIPPAQTFLMTSDSIIEDNLPRTTNIAYRLGWLKDKCKPEDTVVFYFAGHGANIEGESFLMTEEADNRSVGTLQASSLKAAILADHMSKIPARRILMILDCCRNDPSGQKSNVLSSVTDSFSADFALKGNKERNATLFACSIGERSWEWKEKQHGFFTYHLAEGLREGAVEPDGRITVSKLEQHLVSTVPTSTQKYSGARQMPQMFYQGQTLKDWTLATTAPPAGAAKFSASAPSKLVAELDATRARLDQEIAARKQAEDRLTLVESQRKKLEASLALLEKQASVVALGSSPEAQSALDARGQAMQKLETANQAAQAAKAANAVDLEILQTEKEQLLAENQALQARIKVLELKLGKSNLSASRSAFILEDPEVVALNLQADRLESANPTSPDSLKARIAAARHESTLWAQRLQLVERESRDTLNKLVQSHPEIQKEVEVMSAQIELYQQGIASLQAHIKLAEAALLESENRLQAALARASLLEAKSQELESRVRHLERENLALAEKLEAAKTQAAKSGDDLEATARRAATKFKGKAFDKPGFAMGTTTRRLRFKDILYAEPNTGDEEMNQIR